jgi:hypothetical protein
MPRLDRGIFFLRWRACQPRTKKRPGKAGAFAFD